MILSAIVVLYGCKNGSDNQDDKQNGDVKSIKEFYYNLNDFTSAKYYVYSCKEDSNRTEYWKMSAGLENDFLITEAFNSSFEQFEYFKEKFDNTGSRLIEYTMINGEQRTETTPIHDDVFIWSPKEDYSYRVQYPNNDDQILFTKSRKLIGKEKIWVFKTADYGAWLSQA